MRKHILFSLLLLTVILFAGDRANAGSSRLEYSINNNSAKEINVKLQTNYESRTKKEHTLSAGKSVTGGWDYNEGTNPGEVIVSIKIPGKNNNLGCTIDLFRPYRDDVTTTFNIVYSPDNVLSVQRTDSKWGEYFSFSRSCNAGVLNP